MITVAGRKRESDLKRVVTKHAFEVQRAREEHPEHPGDGQPLDNGRGHRAADALNEPRGDEYDLAVGKPAHGRGDREHAQSREEHAAARYQVADPAREQQQPAERNQVRVHDPREARLREPEVVLN
jgi:hypothetical protein